MKRLPTGLLILALFMLLVLLPCTSFSSKEKRVALIIGNGAYKSSPLVNPVNDANDMAAALKKLGFFLRLKINVNQRSMENAIRAFGKDLRSGGVGLFYFAGHGIQVHGRNYLIPVGADIESETDVKYESVDTGRVLDAMYNAENGLNIVILDACRDNPYARSFRSSSIGLARMDAPKGTLIAYSTSPGSIAFDGSGRNSPYTNALLKYIAFPDISIEQVFKRTRRDVDTFTDGKQTPWESTSLTGDFYFISSGEKITSVRIEPNDRSIQVRKKLPIERFVTIGTGHIKGVYYPTGGAIAKIFNKKSEMYGIQCEVRSTKGSIVNIDGVISGEMEFGMAQSDRQYQAFRGLSAWKTKGPQRRLRSVFSVHPESLTLVATSDSGIYSIQDLKGKRVNIGNPGSIQRQMSIDALSAVGLNYRRDINAKSAHPHDSHALLQNDQIDAFFYTVAHPSGSIRVATQSRRKVRIIPVTGPGINRLIDKCPYYVKSFVPMRFYPDAVNDHDVWTFGLKATFVTSASVPDDVFYGITKEVFDNFEDFKKLHPAYTTLTRRKMLDALSALIHPGALRYYRMVGLK